MYESILKRLALPAEFGVALLIFCFALSVAPYFSGLDAGVVKVPSLEPRQRRRLKVLGPLCLLLVILLHVPVLPSTQTIKTGAAVQTVETDATTTHVSSQGASEPLRRPSSKPEDLNSDGKPTPLPHKPAPPQRHPYLVTLLIPSDMSAATVSVNDRSASVIRRTQNVIVIEVDAVPRDYSIRLENVAGRICATTQTVTADGQTLNPCYM